MPAEKSKPEDRRKFAVAVQAAVTDEKRAEWKPRKVLEHGRPIVTPRTDAFTRADIMALREAGATRDEVLDYARHAGLSETQVEHLDADLDSYGEWS